MGIACSRSDRFGVSASRNQPHQVGNKTQLGHRLRTTDFILADCKQTAAAAVFNDV